MTANSRDTTEVMREDLLTPTKPLLQEAESLVTPSALAKGFRSQAWMLLILPIVAGALAFAASYLVDPRYSARLSLLAPQSQQNQIAGALASLGPLAGLAGAGVTRTPADQYIALMQSVSVSDRIIEKFDLLKVYDEQYKVDARKKLATSVVMGVGKKDGLITIEVEDKSPQRAADMANQYVDELRRFSATLAVTEAQQRRAFFEVQLKTARERLDAAQAALQGSGFSAGALKAEPRAAAESYARVRAEITASEVKLRILRETRTDATPEVQQQLAALSALKGQLQKMEAPSDRGSPSSSTESDFISRLREFKYQETLFELFAKQYEIAKIDESREGTLIQVIDVAKPAEKKSKPKRLLIATSASAATLFLVLAWTIGLVFRQASSKMP